MAYGFISWKPETPNERIVQIIASEGFLTLTIFAILGFIWSLFAPRWLERLIQTIYTKLLLAIGILLFLGVCVYVYFRF